MQFDEEQRRALKELKSGSILVGGTGSGKSRTALAYYFIKECGGSIEIVDVPGSLYSPMKKDIDLYIITTAAKRDKREWEQEMIPFFLKDVVIDSWNNIAKYVEVKDSFFIFDEQRVVGTGSWVKAFLKITKKNQWILLSATPGDTWSDYAPVFIANGFYKNITEFNRRHVVYSRFAKYPKVDHYVECGLLAQHRKEVLVPMEFERPTMSHHETIKVEYDKELYSYAFEHKWDVYKDEPCQDAGSMCIVLRKIVNSDKSREWVLYDIYEKHKKAIVFYNYDYELEILRRFAKENNIIFAEWNGHVHQEIPKSGMWLYYVQYTAGAEGWNCIETDCTVFYSQTYSYKASIQAAGRIDRMNTPFKDLYFYHFRSAASIDNAIANCLRNKQNFNEKSFIDKKG